MTDIYEVLNNINIDQHALFLRRQGYVAYVECDGSTTYLITNYIPYSINLKWIGRR